MRHLARASDGDLAGFIRSLSGLEREAAQEACADFISFTTLSTRQPNPINMIVTQLTRDGKITTVGPYDPRRTEIAPMVLERCSPKKVWFVSSRS